MLRLNHMIIRNLSQRYWARHIVLESAKVKLITGPLYPKIMNYLDKKTAEEIFGQKILNS